MVFGKESWLEMFSSSNKYINTYLLLLMNIISFIFYISSNLNGVVFSTLISLILFMITIRKKYRYISLLDPLIIIPIFMLIYTHTFPILRYSLNLINLDIMTSNFEVVLFGTFLSSTTIIIYSIIILNFHQSINYVRLNSKIKKFKFSKFNLPFDLILVYVSWLYFQNFVTRGGLQLILFDSSRYSLSQTLNESSFWLIKYYVVAYSIYFLIALVYKNINFFSIFNYIRIFLLSFFWIINLIVGNRREILYILLVFFLVYNLKGLKIKKRIFILFIPIISSLFLWGYFRNYVNGVYLFDQNKFILEIFGDFMFPIQTLYYYIENNSGLFLGSTYFRILLLVIPSFIWPEKPISLAREFVVELGGGIGYAFTPFTEAFMNFSYLFPIIFPILFILIIRLLYKIALKFPILYLVIFMQIISFNRSESSASIYESIIFFVLLTSMYLINNLKIRRVRIL